MATSSNKNKNKNESYLETPVFNDFQIHCAKCGHPNTVKIVKREYYNERT